MRPRDHETHEPDDELECTTRNVKMSCENARSLVPSYLDGELSEEQAAPLREHLFACPGCREVAKGEKALKRWFSEAAAASVVPAAPSGFAARVARRAFAGDRGVLTPVREPRTSGKVEASVLPFLLKACAVAAAILFVLALQIQQRSIPSGSQMQADDRLPSWEQKQRPDAGATYFDRPAYDEAERGAQDSEAPRTKRRVNGER